MTKKNAISRLLRELHELYHKLYAIDLRKHMKLYHRNTSNDAPDISTLVTANFDKLAASSKPHTTGTRVETTSKSSASSAKLDDAKQPGKQQPGIISRVSAFIRPKKIFTRIKVTDQYMGEKLKDSTWSHLHTAMLDARQGNAVNAKLHADIANNALKEAAHYMSDDDYEAFCKEVAEAFKELDGQR